MHRLFITALACWLSVSLFCQNEYSLSFDGGNSVEIADVNSSLDDISSEITIEASIYIHEIPNGNHSRIVHRSEGVGGVSNRYGFSITPIQAGNGKLEFFIENVAGIQSSYSLNLYQWYHVAGVYDGNQISVYINGQLAGFTEASGSFQVDDWPFWIGSANGNSHFVGKIDYVKIWNQALSEEMLSQYMHCPLIGTEEGLVGYWDIEEGFGNNVSDISGNGNNGIIHGASWSNGVGIQNQICNENNTLGPCNNQTSVTYQGYEYDIVEIGDQCWFAENCRYLPNISDPSTISPTDPHAYVYGYYGSSVEEAMNSENYNLYGGLYNYPAVNDWALCPSGWLVASDADWSQLTDIWGLDQAGQVLKSSENDYPSWDGTNEVNFNAVAAGYQDNSGFMHMGQDGLWWTSTLEGAYAWRRGMITGSDAVSPIYGDLKDGFSVRCVTDQLVVSISGCTDNQACNFNENAVEDDGSCEYITPVDLGEDIETCDESVTLDAGAGYD